MMKSPSTPKGATMETTIANRLIEVTTPSDATCEAISLAHCSAIYKAIQAAGLPSAPALDLLARCDRAANYGNTETALHLFHEACTMATDLGFTIEAGKING